jgi:uncharacterized protein YebE (UPF0316 family)
MISVNDKVYLKTSLPRKPPNGRRELAGNWWRWLYNIPRMIETFLNAPPLIASLFIFCLRIVDISFYTLRLLAVHRGQKIASLAFGFVQSLIFVVVVSSVIRSIDNLLNLIAYAAGFATGSVVGMALEKRLITHYTNLQIISPRYGQVIAARLRENGYAVTEIPARGKNGAVTLLECSLKQKRAGRVIDLVEGIDPEAFITAEELRSHSRGFLS